MTTKLVEVALPLEAISLASRRDKDKKTGTIKNVHKWFAPMPTPAWRALLFATLVNDPGDEAERAELLDLVERLVPSDGEAPDETTLDEAKEYIDKATSGDVPTVFDPFCGGGSTLVEAQRLGLPAVGSDLNPVPVLITRLLTELVPAVAGHPPLVPKDDELDGMPGGPLEGFLSDCRHYAQRVRDEVWRKIGYLYPSGRDGTVVAWLWARTVMCPNPACRATAPLVSSFWLTKRKNAQTWVEPVDGKPGGSVRFVVRTGTGGPPPPPKIGRGGTFRCIICAEPIPEEYLKSEGMSRRLGTQLLAAAVDHNRSRHYESPEDCKDIPFIKRPEDAPDLELPDDMRAFWCKLYGVETYADVFTDRQLITLGTFADAVAFVDDWVRADGGDEIYAAAVASVLGLCLGKLAQANSTQVRWNARASGSSKAEPAFSRHALPMVWDFTETNPFGGSVGDWMGVFRSVSSGIRSLPQGTNPAQVFQADARVAGDRLASRVLVATDPPYFAQIGYADLSDYFYIWHRRALARIHPDLFTTIATPKTAELIAAPYRQGGKDAAKKFFIDGFTEAFRCLARVSSPDLPMLVVYAHRQEESDDTGLSSTAWDALLTALMSSGLRVVGTWPIHGTRDARQISLGTNALASYVVFVCRLQARGARVVDRQGFVAALRADLPRAIRKLQEGAISTIDLGQATIGPGMAIFSRFARVIEPTGKAMTVGSALKLIMQVQGEVLEEFVGDLDSWTRWAMVWYRDHGFDEGAFDDAEKLFKTTNTSLDGVAKAGIGSSRGGKVRLTTRDELPNDWSPDTDRRPTVWEVTQHLVRRLTAGGGEWAAAQLLRESGRFADEARSLAYWLSNTAATQGRPKDALDYDALVTSWPELVRLAEREQGEGPATLSYGE
jgi:putative DNA methylase